MYWVVSVDRHDRWGPFETEDVARKRIEDMLSSYPYSVWVITKQVRAVSANVVPVYL